MMAGSAFEGADRFDQALALWQPPVFSADMDILPEKGILDARVRDATRNDAYVANGAQLHKDNIVGTHFLLNAKPASKLLGLDETWEQEFQEEVETKFPLWGESPNNWVDASSINTFTGLVRLAVGISVAAGEVLATVEWQPDGRPFGTTIQMVDTDRLSDPRMSVDANVFMLQMQGLLRGGVERNLSGAPQAYWIQPHHPSEFFGFNAPLQTWKRVPRTMGWGRLQVLHIMEQMRPDQTRGVSTMVSALKEMRITKRFRDVVLQNAVVQASFAATIESELPSDTVFSQLGGGDPAAFADSVQGSITNYAQGYLGAINKYAGAAKNLNINGAKIPHLFPGTKLQMRPAGASGPLGSEFEQSLLRYIAANLGVSYEQLSKDYSRTNYSSARAAMSETWKHMQATKKAVADRFATAVYRLWLEEAVNTGEITCVSKKTAASLYTGGFQNLSFDALTACDWIGASRGQIDELKETQAAIQRLLFGLSTWEEELGRLGKDWRKVYAQIEREQAEQKSRGILQSMGSNMANATTGAVNTKKEPGESTTPTGPCSALAASMVDAAVHPQVEEAEQ